MSVKVIPDGYHEHEDFKCFDHPEPNVRSQNVVFFSGGHTWHVKLTFHGTIIREGVPGAIQSEQKSRQNRRRQLQDFASRIRFGSLPLLNDTVTEISFSSNTHNEPRVAMLPLESAELPLNSGYSQFSGQFCYQIAEDQSRLFYPPPPENLHSWVDLSDIELIHNIAPGIRLVRNKKNGQDHVFKSIERPLYQPDDSKILMQEFLNLRDLRHCQDIIQLINAVVSPNPYHTGISDVCKPVLRGFLLEHHEAGTLDAALGRGSYRSRWAFQIAHGLQQMHRKRIAHMDLKPTNIVISSKDDANIIDVSGLAVTREWLAPEFQEHLDPSALPWDSRVRNIYGHLASSSQRWYNLNMIQRRLPSSQE